MFNLKEIQIVKHDFSFLRQYWLSLIKLCFSKWYPFNVQKCFLRSPPSKMHPNYTVYNFLKCSHSPSSIMTLCWTSSRHQVFFWIKWLCKMSAKLAIITPLLFLRNIEYWWLFISGMLLLNVNILLYHITNEILVSLSQNQIRCLCFI